MKRSKEMKRSAFKQKAPTARMVVGGNRIGKTMAIAALQKKQAPAKRSTLKTKGPRMTPIRRAAMGEECLLALPGVCNRDPATVVLCHSNSLADGKGMGLKAPDTAACFGCSACHDVLDGRRPRPDWLTILLLEAAFARAVDTTHVKLKLKGLMK